MYVSCGKISCTVELFLPRDIRRKVRKGILNQKPLGISTQSVSVWNFKNKNPNVLGRDIRLGISANFRLWRITNAKSLHLGYIYPTGKLNNNFARAYAKSLLKFLHETNWRHMSVERDFNILMRYIVWKGGSAGKTWYIILNGFRTSAKISAMKIWASQESRAAMPSSLSFSPILSSSSLI